MPVPGSHQASEWPAHRPTLPSPHQRQRLNEFWFGVLQEPWLHEKLYDQMLAIGKNWSSLSSEEKDRFCRRTIDEFHLENKMASVLSRLNGFLTRVSAFPTNDEGPIAKPRRAHQRDYAAVSPARLVAEPATPSTINQDGGRRRVGNAAAAPRNTYRADPKGGLGKGRQEHRTCIDLSALPLDIQGKILLGRAKLGKTKGHKAKPKPKPGRKERELTSEEKAWVKARAKDIMQARGKGDQEKGQTRVGSLNHDGEPSQRGTNDSERSVPTGSRQDTPTHQSSRPETSRLRDAHSHGSQGHGTPGIQALAADGGIPISNHHGHLDPGHGNGYTSVRRQEGGGSQNMSQQNTLPQAGDNNAARNIRFSVTNEDNVENGTRHPGPASVAPGGQGRPSG